MNVVPAVWIPYPRPAASVELRCGVLYRGCQCVKRDGLQQDCPRSQCQGRPPCLDYPAPTCGPSGNAPRYFHAPCDVKRSRQSCRPSDSYLNYKRKLDKKYLTMAQAAYLENPPFNVRDSIPCPVHNTKLTKAM